MPLSSPILQLTDEGFLIIGDKKYRATAEPARRLGLHSYVLRFPHPITDEKLSCESALPEIMNKM